MSATRLRRLVAFLSVALVLAAGFVAGGKPVATAANGDFVHKTNFSVACSSGIGVGIAFDGEFLWYSCYSSSPDLFKAEALTGNVVASYNVAGGLGALAWDGKRKLLWAGWGGGAGGGGVIRRIDPTTGAATVAFTIGQFVNDGIDDGLAYDAQDDSLYISPDTATTIDHYSITGSNLGSFPWTGAGCYNSGLAIGGSLLYQGSDGCSHVWVIDKLTHAPAFNFATNVTGDSNYRDEDLECDSVTFSPRTVMWSVEAYEPRRAVAFEVPPGSCGTGGGVDSDGDGLLDEWETDGVWIDPDGAGPIAPQFIDLHAMGADPNKPDVFLHVDWMQSGAHSHQLSQAAIKKVVDAFANSGYVSPTGSVGINLHVDEGSGSILDWSTMATWGALSRAHALAEVTPLGTSSGGSYNWSAFQAIKDSAGGFTQTGRTPIFHYVISAHNYDSTTSSGISRGIGASDLIVSLGSFTGSVGSTNEQAGTLMHELGHNLGLHHGGGDDANYKPNYLSIMSYAFQMQGVIKGGAFGTLDYSRSALPNRDEHSLSEPAGLGAGAAGYGTVYSCPGGALHAVAGASANVDWNCDGDTVDTGLATDINKTGGSLETLTGYDDWAHIQFKGGAIGLAGVVPDLPSESELDLLTPEVAAEVPAISAECSANPSLTWMSPLSSGAPADVNAGDNLSIRFQWNSCSPPDTSVSIRIRNAATNALITGYTYGAGITYDSGTGEYRQDFQPSAYGVAGGTQLKVMVYFGGKLKSTSLVNVH
ncbi:MAG TPA: hypothetical protein VGK74_00470 [Symbiobacteriaceae bacterium]|jgi:hypothetical protein